MGDVELVLRFFAFKNNFQEFRHDIGGFMTDYMERVTDGSGENELLFNYEAEEHAFKKTFFVLAQTLKDNTCLRWFGEKYGGAFSMHQFEAITLGLARQIERIDADNDDQVKAIGEAFEGVKRDGEFKKLTTGGGKNSKGPYQAKIDFVASRVRAAR